MRRVAYLLGAALVTGLIAGPASAQEPKPFPGKQAPVLLYADTVNGSSPIAPTKRRAIGCTQLTYFKRGEQIVFRVWGTEAETGETLTAENVKYAYVKIPGQENLRMGWGPHGAASNRVWFWTAAFKVPHDYPLGVMPFRIVIKTESNKFGIFDQSALPETLRLTITP